MSTLRSVSVSALLVVGLLVAGAGTASAVDVVDTAASAQPQDVAVSPNGQRVYTADYSSSTIGVFDTDGLVLDDFIPLTHRPTSLAVSPDGGTLVVGHDTAGVTFVSAATGTVLGTTATAALVTDVVFSTNGQKVFVANYNGTSLSVLSAATRALITTIPLRTSADAPIAPEALAVSPNGNALWIAAYGQSSVLRMNPSTHAVTATYATGASPSGIAVSADSSAVYVTSYGGSTVRKLSATTGANQGQIAVGSQPNGLAIDAAGDFLYTTNGGDSTVSVIDLEGFSRITDLPLPNSPRKIAAAPDGSLYAALPFSNQVIELGYESFRLAGADRYSTSATISYAAYPGTADVVFVSTGANYPDALAAGPVAAREGGPLLLTEPGGLPPQVRNEIIRLDPERIVVLGGTGAVSATVEAQLEEIADVERWQGPDRYATARTVVRESFGFAPQVFLATGENFPDALSAGAGGAAKDRPVILVNGRASSVDIDTLNLLESLGTTEVVIVGGTSVVSPAIEAQLDELFTVVRLAGADRFETSMLFNRHVFATSGKAFMATGANFPDALSGAALAAIDDAPLYVVNGPCVPRATAAALIGQHVGMVGLLGGPAVLSDAVRRVAVC